MKQILLFAVLLITAACTSLSDRYTKEQEYKILYAKGFEVHRFEEYTQVIIHNPWDSTKNLQKFVLIRPQEEEPAPKDLPEGTVLEIPLQSIATTNDHHLVILQELSSMDLHKGTFKAGRPENTALQLIMTVPYQNISYPEITGTGIPMLDCADYMESTPLGRAEWIRLYGLFLDREAQADSIFEEVTNNYNELLQITSEIAYHPRVICGTKTGATWYMPGGASMTAQLYGAAGASYIWKDNSNKGSLPKTFEEVFAKGADADFWLIENQENATYSSLESDYRLNANFQPWKERHIYQCNLKESGYNELTPFHPELLLKDLINIFYPDILEDDELRFYRPLEEK